VHKSPSLCIVSNTGKMVSMRRHLLESCVAKGFSVVVLAPLDIHLKNFKGLPGVSFQQLVKLKPGSMNPWDDWLFYRELKANFKKLRPDVIFTFTIKPNIYGAHAAGRLGIPCIPSVTGLGYSYLIGGYQAQIAFAMYRWAFKNVKSVFFLNSSDQHIFDAKGIIDIEESRLVPGAGVDLKGFTPASKATSAPFTFLYVGRLLGHKGIREYVAAAKQLQKENISARFAVVGPLDTYNPSAIPPEEIAKWISDGIIQYHGEVQDVRSYYKASDILVLPSYREGLSTVIVESLAMERPVIASEVPGCLEAVDASCGWLVPPRNSQELAKQMKACMMLDSEILAKMGENGRERVKVLFSTQQAVKPYMDALRLIKQGLCIDET